MDRSWSVCPTPQPQVRENFLSANGPREASRWERGAASPGLVGAAQPHPVETMAGVREPGDRAGHRDPRAWPLSRGPEETPSTPGLHLSELQLCLLDAALGHVSPPPPLPPFGLPFLPQIMARAPHQDASFLLPTTIPTMIAYSWCMLSRFCHVQLF